VSAIANLARYRALEAYVAECERESAGAPPETRGELVREAIAARTRMLELERAAA